MCYVPVTSLAWISLCPLNRICSIAKTLISLGLRSDVFLAKDNVFSNHFRKSWDVFLLIRSNGNAPPTGGFLIREGSKILSETPYLQFTFGAEFALRAAREVSPALPPPAPVPAGPTQTVVTAAPPTARLAALRPVIFAAAGAVILAAGVSFAIWSRPPAAVSDGIGAQLARTPEKSIPLELKPTSC